MTDSNQIERQLRDLFADTAPASVPDRLVEAVMSGTTTVRQRPSWTLLERWLPMDSAITRSAGGLRPSLRPLLIILILVLVAALAVSYAGSQHRVPPPFGPADNGAIAYGTDDIYIRNAIDGTSRLLIGGPGSQAGPGFSPDGQLIAYDNTVDGVDHLWVANADGSEPRQVFDQSISDSWVDWSGDSRQFSIVGGDNATTTPSLYIASVDGSPATKVDLGDLIPNRTAVWDPQVPGQLLFRGATRDGPVGLYYVRQDGSGLRPLPTPWPAAFGKDWDLSGHAFSDDGRHIALNVITDEPGNGPGGYYRIGLIDRDGSNARILAGPMDHGTNEGWPTFSPDGRWITAQRFRWADDPASGLASLALMPADGSQVGHDVIPPFTPADNAEIDAAWAPDSSRLLAWVVDTKQAFSIDPTTGDRELLPWADDVPAWQRAAH